MPRWRRPLCACVKASANVREAALGSRYFWASASAVSRSDAMPVAKERRTDAPGTSLIRWRRLKIGSSTTPVVPDNARPSSAAGRVGVPAAAEESRAIGLPFDGALRPAFEAQDVHRPHGRLARIPRAPMAEQRRAVGQVFRFEKQFAEGRMREIVGRGARTISA